MPPNAFLATLPRLRRVLTRVGDSPQRIAARELGDATRWIQIVQINGLDPPYLTDDSSQRSATVLLAGQDQIQVPDDSGQAQATPATDTATAFGTDVAVVDGDFVDDGAGDLAVVSGVENVKQALQMRLDTDLGELLFHQNYGNGARALRGSGGRASLVNLASQLVQRCVRGDDRVSAVRSFKTNLSGDALTVTGQAVLGNGTPIDVATG